MKSACVLSIDEITWDWLLSNQNVIHLLNFKHNSSNWGGRDDLERTLKLEKLKLTGQKIFLGKPIILKGEDYDMGHFYKWEFEVNTLLQCKKK